MVNVTQGNSRRLHVDVCLEQHSQDIGRFADDEVGFVATENAYSTEENSVSIEQLVAAALTDKRPAKLSADLISQLHQDKRDAFSGRLGLALAKSVPLVMLERWDAARAKLYEMLHEEEGKQSNLAVDAFVSGDVDAARFASAVSATLMAFEIKARDAEMARNLTKLDEIVTMPHFGLQGRKPARGLTIIGVQHYDVVGLAANLPESTTDVSLHPKSLDYDIIKRCSYMSQLFESLKDRVELPNTMASAGHQVNHVLRPTYAALSGTLLKSVFANLVIDLIPAAVFEELRSEVFRDMRLAYAVTSQFVPEGLEEISRKFGESGLFGGYATPFSVEQQERLRYAVNEQLLSNKGILIPSTMEESKAILGSSSK